MRQPWLVLLCGCLFMEMSQSELVYKTKKIDCVGNPVRMANISCNLKAIDWNLSIVNMETTLLRTLNNIVVRIQIFQKDYTNQYKPFLVDVNINLCDVMERRNFIPYGTIFLKILKSFSNMNHSCPYKGTLFVHEGYLDAKLLPPFPKGVYLFRLTVSDFYENKSEYMGTVNFCFQVMDEIKRKKRPSSKKDFNFSPN